MINDHIQKQEGGDQSTNLQCQNLVYNQGMSVTEYRAVALDVFNANFLRLSREAAEIAIIRATSITQTFFNELQEKNEAALEQMRDPAMQSALFEAQKQYVKSGDSNLESMLVKMLVDRASFTTRNTKQIALDEALSVVNKLTEEQLDILTLNFSLTSLYRSVGNIDELIRFIKNEIMVFVNDVEYHESWFSHLAYCGCVTFMSGQWYKGAEFFLLGQYPAMFQKGFDKSELEASIGFPVDTNFEKTLFMLNFHSVNKLQFNAMNTKSLTEKAKMLELEEETISKLIKFYSDQLMNESEVLDFIKEKIPEFELLSKKWGGEHNTISAMKLTSVGTVLAQANYTHKVGDIEFDLGHWIK
ncbi:hypothetical protein BCU46_04820 [Enterovibrio norvegicus]|uniref:LPO_1073/Vpar_1526 family protein n=1 Tax=Enterovibrio norvegicus TaxID=188144 RepID=UPI000C84731E|nr:LPO_1073/Vpar_1526 family protein [Enterovibrio norvegicus]PMI40725.1 hypothetical protein BCU46_04820 [Enterovibrio norvegicus]